MKRAYRYIAPAALAVMTLAGCANEANEPQATAGNGLPTFTATIGAQSRAYDQAWEEADEIGVSGAGRTNVCYFTAGGNGRFAVKNSGEEIYYQSDDEVTFTAYYPWLALADGEEAINADTHDQSQQKSFDFLWASATGNKADPEVKFMFGHKMTKLVLTVHPGVGFSYDEVKATLLSLEGFSHAGSFNTTDGSVAAGEPGEAWTFSDFATPDDDNQTLTFSFILFPQVFSNPLALTAALDMPDGTTLSLGATVDFTSSNSGKDGDNAKNEWVAGRQYNLSLTLGKAGIIIDDCVINQWEQTDEVDIPINCRQISISR